VFEGGCVGFDNTGLSVGCRVGRRVVGNGVGLLVGKGVGLLVGGNVGTLVGGGVGDDAPPHKDPPVS
jgi:hypothetical protein